jgi:hypothetical protein
VNRLSTSGLIAKGGIKNFLDVKRDSSIQQEMKEFAPHQVLIIQEVGATFTNGLNTGATLVLQVDDVATQDTIWKARLASSWEFGADIQPIIAKVMEAMQGDGLLATGAVPQA